MSICRLGYTLGQICLFLFFYPFLTPRKTKVIKNGTNQVVNGTKKVVNGDTNGHTLVSIKNGHNGYIVEKHLKNILMVKDFDRLETLFIDWYKKIGRISYELALFGSGKGNPIMRLAISLSLSMYIINYYIIRLDFFTSRLMYSVTIYTLSKRILYSVVVSFMAAYVFHVLIVAPFDKLRRSFKSKTNSK